MTAQCNELPPEWLGAFHSLVMPLVEQGPSFRSINERVKLEAAMAGPSSASGATAGSNATSPALLDNFALFVSVLLSRQCFTFSDFAHNVLFICLATGLKTLESQMEPSLRLMCHVLYRLFTADQNKTIASGSGGQQSSESCLALNSNTVLCRHSFWNEI